MELVDRSVQIHKQGVGAVTVVQSSRELPKKGDGLTTTVAGHIRWTRRFRTSTAVFHCLVGLILTGWGISDIERFVLGLVLGLCFLAYGSFGFMQARGRSEPAPAQKKGTQTA
jgi:hypothetical protein